MAFLHLPHETAFDSVPNYWHKKMYFHNGAVFGAFIFQFWSFTLPLSMSKVENTDPHIINMLYLFRSDGDEMKANEGL